jgi:hypothetical protein
MIKQILFYILCVSSVMAQNQDFNVNWTPYIQYEPQTTGDFKHFLGSDDQLVYGYFMPSTKKGSKNDVYLCAFDKISMKKTNTLLVHCDDDVKHVVMSKENIYIVTEHYEEKTIQLSCSSYNTQFKSVSKHKTIFKQQAAGKYSGSQQYKVCTNPKANDYLYILSEKPAIKNEKIKMEYLVVDQNLAVINTGQQELPVIALSAASNGSTYFSVGDDGMIVAKNQVKADKETREQEKIYSYALLTAINPLTKASYTLPLRANGKDIEDYIFVTEKNRLKVYGIYTGKDDRGKFNGEKGIFLTTYNTLNNEIEKTSFIKAKGFDADFETLSLDRLKQHRDGSVTLIGSESQNIITQSKNGTSYTNRKGDIYVANITFNGELKWEKTLSRYITYADLFVDDLQVAEKNNNLYIVYADEFTRKEKKKAAMMGDKRNKKDMRDFLSYYVVSLNDGQNQNKEIKLNSGTEMKDNMRYVNSSRITEYNNTFYLDGFNTEIKKGVTTLACGTACLLGAGCLYYGIKSNNGSAFTGGGSLGTISFK